MLLFSVLLILRTAVGGGFRPAVRACCLGRLSLAGGIPPDLKLLR